MYCKKCGTESKGALVYCNKCGALLADSDDFDDPLVEFEQKVDNLFEEFELRRRRYTQVRNSQSGSGFDFYDASDYQPPPPLSSVSSKTDVFSRVKDRMTQSDGSYGTENVNRQTLVFDWGALSENGKSIVSEKDSEKDSQEASDISPPSEKWESSVEADLLDDSLIELVRMNKDEAAASSDDSLNTADSTADIIVEVAHDDEQVVDLSQLEDLRSQEDMEEGHISTADELIAKRQEEKRKLEEDKPLNFFNFETNLSEDEEEEAISEEVPMDSGQTESQDQEKDERPSLPEESLSGSEPSDSVRVEELTQEKEAEKQPHQVKKKSRKGKWIALGFLAIAIAAGALYFFLFSPQAVYSRTVKNGDALLAANDYEKAVAVYNEAMELFPEKTEALVGLSKAYLGMNQSEDALKVLESAITLAPDNPEFYKSAGPLYAAMGDIDSAIQLMKKAYELDQDDATKMELELLIEGEIEVSEKPGNYKKPISIQLHAGEKSQAIYYTTDGSDPTASSTIYENSIALNNGENTIKAAAAVSGQLGQIYTFKYTLDLPAFQISTKSELKETVSVKGKSFDVSIAIPTAGEGTLNQDKVNSVLEEDLKKINEIYSEVSQKDYSIMNEWKISSLKIYYNVYEYKDMYCLVVVQQLKYQGKGGLEEYHVYYYDGSAGQLVDVEEYAEKCGFTTKDVLEKYNSSDAVKRGLSKAQKDIKPLQLYIDEKGTIYFLSYKAN